MELDKRKWLSIVEGNEEFFKSRIICLMIESMVCHAYGFLHKPSVSDVRYEKCCGGNFFEPSKIPPTKDKLHQHVKRVNCQASL